jgi:hypothetical protein
MLSQKLDNPINIVYFLHHIGAIDIGTPLHIGTPYGIGAPLHIAGRFEKRFIHITPFLLCAISF